MKSNNASGPLRETLKQAGYTHEKTLGNGSHLLRDTDGKREIWQSRKGHASFGLIYKNTHLEFVSSPVDTNANGLPVGIGS